MCESCYLGDKLTFIAYPDVAPCVGFVCIGSSLRAAEYELGRELQ